MQDAHAQGTPLGAVLGGEPVHDRVGAEPGGQPAVVDGGAEAEHLLGAAGLDLLPDRVRGGGAFAFDPDLELGREPFGEGLGGQVVESRRRAGGSAG